MSDSVRVSVVVATRNRASTLADCLRSLTAQTTNVPFEIVVVDNGSSDATPQIVGEWRARDERVRLIKEPAVGLSRAKNTGIRNARGRLLLFTDDDVIVREDWIAAYVSFHDGDRGALALAGGSVLPLSPDLSRWPHWLLDAATADLPRLYHGARERTLRELEWLWGANMAAPKALFDEVGEFDEGLGRSGEERGTYEDVELGDRVRAAGGELWYCPAAVVSHRVPADAVRPRSIVRKAFNRGANDFGRARRTSYFEATFPVPVTSISAAAALPWMLAGSAVAAAAFRLKRNPIAFELARRAAWGAGWCMAASTATGPDLLAGAARRVALLGRRLALRLMPG